MTLPHTELRGSADGLDYRVHLPVRPAQPRRAADAGGTGGAVGQPLFVMLHGCLQDAGAFGQATHMLVHARDAVVLYPEQSAAANPQRCWNWFNPDNQRRDGGEAAQIAALTRRIAAEHDVDVHRIYVAGISAGGMMAAIMAAAYPDIFAALGVHSAGAFPTAATVAEALAVMRSESFDDAAAVASAEAAWHAMGDLARSMPVIVMHGYEDSVVNVANAEHAARSWWLVHARAGGGTAEPQEALRDMPVMRRSGTEAGRAFEVVSWAATGSAAAPAGAPVIELWRVAELGHAWSGGVDGASYADAAGPDAARVMVQFLLRHRRP
jgi:poly(hydroxyalkanoate) depolymerase family esterase